MMGFVRFTLRLALLLGLGLSLTSTTTYALDEIIRSAMYKEPYLPEPKMVRSFQPRNVELWVAALGRSDREWQCQAASTIALAQRQGMPGLSVTVDPLLVVLDEKDQHPTVRLAVAKALVALDAKESASRLFSKLPSANFAFRQIVEPALGRWRHAPMRKVWFDRLQSSDPTPPEHILAIRGLANWGEKRALGRLRELVLSPGTPTALRLESANALAKLQPDGLEAIAEGLGKDAGPRGLIKRLLAVKLLMHHRSESAQGLLKQFANDTEPAIVALASRHLLEVDSEKLLPVLPKLLASKGTEVRKVGVDLAQLHPSDANIALLGERLGDRHIEVRVRARKAMLDLAQNKDKRAVVVARAMAAMRRRGWQAQEQAILLLVQLDHKPAAVPMVRHLEAPRPEVFVSAGWGICQLNVAETYEPVLKYINEVLPRINTNKLLPGRGILDVPMIDHQLSHLLQMFGKPKYRPSEPTLRKFILMNENLAGEARAGAVWALGWLHEGTPDPKLVPAFEQLLRDSEKEPPALAEYTEVCGMAAVSLGRMKAESALPTLRQYYDSSPSQTLMNRSCAWAIHEITGEKLVIHTMRERFNPNWFLVPITQP